MESPHKLATVHWDHERLIIALQRESADESDRRPDHVLVGRVLPRGEDMRLTQRGGFLRRKTLAWQVEARNSTAIIASPEALHRSGRKQRRKSCQLADRRIVFSVRTAKDQFGVA